MMGSHLDLSLKLSSHNQKILNCQIDRLAHQVGFEPVPVNELTIAKVLSFEKPSKWPLNSEWSFLSLEISSAHIDEEGEIFARFDVAHQNLLGRGFDIILILANS